MQTTMKSAKRVLSFLLIFALVVGTAVGFAPSINNSEVYAATNTITVYVTFAKEGVIVNDNTGKEIAQTPVTVSDKNNDGKFDVDEALFSAHKALLSESDYATATGTYGLYVSKLVGDGSGWFGYYVNDSINPGGLAYGLSDGDYLKAFVYKDQSNYPSADLYTGFEKQTYEVNVGQDFEVKLLSYRDDDSYNWGVYGVGADAKLVVIGDAGNANNGKTTGANGKCTLNFANAGTYYVAAYKDNGSIVPAVTKIEAKELTETIYVTFAKEGALFKDKTGKEIAQTPVVVSDRNHDGTINVDEALYSAHKELLSESDYATATGTYGLYVSKLMGDETGWFNYYVNDTIKVNGPTDSLSDGDYVKAFINKDQHYPSTDVYTGFSQQTYSGTTGNNIDIKLLSYKDRDPGNNDYTWICDGAYAGAKIGVIGYASDANNGKTTDVNGECALNFTRAGTYYVVAYKDDGSIVPAVAKITVTGKSSGGSGGGGGAAATTTTETTQTTATTATTEVETKATVADGKATANVTADDVNKAIENVNKQAATEKASEKEVVLEVKSEGNVDSVEATIPASATKELAKADASVVVKTDCGNVEIPADTMDSIASQASGQDLSVVVENKKAEDVITSDVSEKIKEETGLEKAALDGASIVDVTIKAGNTEITSFGGGKVKLSLPVVGKQIVGKLYKVLAISANGALDMLTGKCSMKNGAKVMDVDSTHLTTFVLTTEEVKNPFSDVKEGDYFYNPVIWAVDKNVTSGKTEDTFAPYEGCTRAQMVTFLWRAAGSPWASANRHFSDVADNAYYKDAVEWAIAAGITNGISDTKFNPNGSVTREQLAAFIYRYAQSMGKGFTGSWMFLLDYDDASQVSQWADEAMHWCVMNNIVTGTTAKTLSPAGEANRAQIVTMLYRYFNL